MQLRKVSETPTTITLGWDPVPGADGYLFYADGKRVSRTFDPKRKTVKFSKGPASFVVEAVRFAHVDSDAWPDTQPPSSFKKVAPRVAYKAGGSDARYCLRDFPSLRDDVASYDANGLCLGGRTDGSPTDCPTSALELDGRDLCSLPTQGDPTKNTGSWTI